nr:unnamed protein product [Callosobruchus analis]
MFTSTIHAYYGLLTGPTIMNSFSTHT